MGVMKAKRVTPPKKTVLLVEDHRPLLEALDRALTRDGFEVLPCTSVPEAIKVLSTRMPQAVVTDWYLARESGLSIVRHIRQTLRNERVIVVVMSAAANEEQHQTCTSIGANAFLKKPFTMTELLDALKFGRRPR